MGDRVSISFRNGTQESVALFSHWRGMALVEEAQGYVQALHISIERELGLKSLPLGRMEPGTVMVDFLCGLLGRMKGVEYDLHLGKDADEGDNSDNGHHVIELAEERGEA